MGMEINNRMVKNDVEQMLVYGMEQTKDDPAWQANFSVRVNRALAAITAYWRERQNGTGTGLVVPGYVSSASVRGERQYGIQSAVRHADGRTVQLPHWYINGDVQGCLDARAAAGVALTMLRAVNPDATFYLYVQNCDFGSDAHTVSEFEDYQPAGSSKE